MILIGTLKRITLCFKNCASMQIDSIAIKSVNLSGIKEAVSIVALSGHNVHKTREVEYINIVFDYSYLVNHMYCSATTMLDRLTGNDICQVKLNMMDGTVTTYSPVWDCSSSDTNLYQNLKVCSDSAILTISK